MTAFPTITGIMQAGARPVVVDITIDDGLIDTARINEKITPRTKRSLRCIYTDNAAIWTNCWRSRGNKGCVS